MGSKNNPGEFDCYANALPDEPMFVLLARDPLAPFLVAIWAMIRAGKRQEAKHVFYDLIVDQRSRVFVLYPEGDKAMEANLNAQAMIEWRRQNNGAWRSRPAPSTEKPNV